MGLNKNTKTPCGFCFVEYFTHEHAVECLKFINQAKCDDRVIKCELDGGFHEGRQYGRGVAGGQIRDEKRTTVDVGRGAIIMPGKNSSTYAVTTVTTVLGKRGDRDRDRDRDRDSGGSRGHGYRGVGMAGGGRDSFGRDSRPPPPPFLPPNPDGPLSSQRRPPPPPRPPITEADALELGRSDDQKVVEEDNQNDGEAEKRNIDGDGDGDDDDRPRKNPRFRDADKDEEE
jgi:RNA recognition motif-containing protein